MVEITSPANPRVKATVRLRQRRHRDKQQRIVIDGAREIRRALDAGVRPVEAFACDVILTESAREVVDRLKQAGVELHDATPAVFDKLTFGDRAEGVVLVAEMPQPKLADIRLGDAPLVAVLEGVEKPGNAGAVIRSGDAAGLDAVILADSSQTPSGDESADAPRPAPDLYNPNTIRASLGTVFSLPVAAAPTDEVLGWLGAMGGQIVAARVDGSLPYDAVDFRRPTAIVLGSEAHGLSEAWHAAGIAAIRLPMRGVADSLNVSATAAVLFYEALRQRG